MKKKVTSCAAIGLVAFSLGCSAARPLHRSPASIRASLLSHTPAGTSYEDVAAFVNGEGWPSGLGTGVPMLSAGRSPMRPLIDYSNTAGGLPTEEVKKHLNVSLGMYVTWPACDRHVEAFWLFGVDDQLLDVWVYKYTDSL